MAYLYSKVKAFFRGTKSMATICRPSSENMGQEKRNGLSASSSIGDWYAPLPKLCAHEHESRENGYRAAIDETFMFLKDEEARLLFTAGPAAFKHAGSLKTLKHCGASYRDLQALWKHEDRVEEECRAKFTIGDRGDDSDSDGESSDEEMGDEYNYFTAKQKNNYADIKMKRYVPGLPTIMEDDGE